MQTWPAWPVHACEKLNKRSAAAVVALVCALAAGASASAQEPPVSESPVPAVAQAQQDVPADDHADDHGALGKGDHAVATAHDDPAHGEEHHEESLLTTLARVANFALLAGGLFYFLRGPIGAHLASRGAQIRGDLAAAAAVRADAARRLSDIEQKLKDLPAELELVKQRGAEEVAAEEARMARQAEVERERLVAQARREIEQQVRTARQALTVHAAALSIEVARERLRATLSDADQHRLADEFTGQVGGVQ